MRRRDFVKSAGAAVAAGALPRGVLAQAGRKVPRVALVTGGVPLAEIQIGKDLNWSALLDQMEKHGYVEGKTIAYDRWFAPNDATVQKDNARKVLASAPDAIFWGGAQATILEALAMNSPIPMVIETGDVVAEGMIANSSHPGGHITGISVAGTPDLQGKVLTVLAESVPGAKRFAYTNTGDNGEFRPTAKYLVDSTRQAADRLGLTMLPFVYGGGGGPTEYEQLFRRVQAANVDMIDFGGEVGITATAIQALLAKLTLEARIPSMVTETGYVRAGGLMSYSANYPALARQCADYVALILGGTNPGDLPVLGPTVFDIGINLKTAKAMGFTFPPSILAQATIVVE